jgi:hypothetical protein
MKNKKIEPEISKHFAELGKKSWESRKAKLLVKTKKTND